MAINLSNLPQISFADTDSTTIESNIITMYESLTSTTLADGDPVRLFLLTIASIVVQQRILIDYSAKQNLLAYSSGNYLDHIGILVGATRLQDSSAETMIRFTLSAVQVQTIIIPIGTRAATLSNIIFATTAVVQIPPGSLTVDVLAKCTTVGVIGNEFLAGQINKIVDPVPYIQSVMNTTTSSGGADIESDDNFRERIHEAPESFSVAGPDGAYIFWAKTASQDIVDVSVRSPSPGQVEIRPLLVDGGIPTSDMLNTVLNVCNDKTIRPLTDQVIVVAPEVVSYNISLTYYISQDNATKATSIQQAVTQAVSDYQTWQYSKLGRSINPSTLIQQITNAGASHVSVVAPIYAALQTYQIAIVGTVTAIFGGLENGD